MSREISVDMYAGGLVFWRATMLPQAMLDEACKELGLDVSWFAINDAKALELALLDKYRRSGVMVRPTKPVEVAGIDAMGEPMYRPAFVTVSESAGDKANEYANLRCFWLDSDYDVWTVDENGVERIEYGIDAKKYRGMVLGSEVSASLEKVVKVVGGYKLRDNARIYYLPVTQMSRWDEVTARLELLGLVFFRANCPADSDTAAAVADNAAEELRERYQKAVDEIMACDSKIADGLASNKSVANARAKRASLLNELEKVKAEAAAIDNSFRGLLSLAGEIGSEIDTAMAMAVLTTSN
jgi:hypothetical protein